jgi:TetR/AcrR family transcriptional repressor of nem operon
MQQEVEQLLLPIVQNPHLRALEKLQRFFSALVRWKSAQKPFLLELLRVWYTDDNALVRQKVRAAGVKRITPLLTSIIRQGLQEGVLTISSPDQVGGMILYLLQGLDETLAGLLLSYEPNQDILERIESTITAYTDALERLLGAPRGSLQFVDTPTLKEWVVLLRDNV